MSYNEYMIEYQIIAGDTIQNNFAFLEASSPENAREKLIVKRDEMITRMMEVPKNITLTLDVVPAFLPFAKLREWQVLGNLNPYLNDSCGSIPNVEQKTRSANFFIKS